MEAANQSGETKSRKKLLLTAASALVLACGLWVFFLAHRRSIPRPNATKEALSIIHLESFVVNLIDSDHRTYLRLGLDLGVASAPEAKKAEVNASSALIRDTVLEVLMSQSSDDLDSAEEKRKLKETIVQKLNARSPELDVREVYFTEFLIQR